MPDVVGSIKPALDHKITEAPCWAGPVRTLVIFDGSGNRHGRIEWLASEVDQSFLDALNELCQSAMDLSAIRSPSAAS